MSYDETQALRDRIRLLEERVRGLRTSRRILMNLLAAQERERRALIARLEAENGRLQRQTARFARAVLERNIRIVRLEESLRQQNGTSLG
ncbi:putative RNase H-like nuclease (RuvC/YqgF family) [Symbiobacterium terraclitae]|uniref:RNase H-like nuclease (RuvC/YqgF family) n=1 Tax=Symbiobacterium terraclitae TaxID=557451 RepID=A0ABS4JMK0_9FIRM|nr:putative RNase H-like nuclease (RuvC/YqgF family) [Symbiobacterium terraclitae]